MKDIVEIILSYHALKTNQIKEIEQGVENACYRIDDTYIIRLNSHNRRYLNEAHVYNLLAESVVPVPNVLVVDVSKKIVPYHYMITTCLEGQSVHPSWRLLTKHEQVSLGYQIGQMLAQIHAYKFEYFGDLRTLSQTKQVQWWQLWYEHFEKFTNKMQAKSHLLKDIIPRLEVIIRERKSFFQKVDEATLIHKDFHLENVLQDKGVLTGVVDMEWAISGDPAYDFATDYHWYKYSENSLDPIYKGYEATRPLDKLAHQRIAMYRLLPMIEDAVYAHDIGWLEGRGWHWSLNQIKQHLSKLELQNS